ncbi:tetratricopeptide repeat protein [Massilia consociata]|uniref:Tetratricopeptide repeat protein n=2 Tax=Massilia consociata TaxID=760117 RepID=A0ABV6FDX2_9BURK
MSLINRMLQDLDARAGQPGADPLPSDIRPVPPPERSLPSRRVAVVAGAVATVALLGAAGWHLLGKAPAGVAASVPAGGAAIASPVVPAAVQPAPSIPAPVVAIEIPVPPREDIAQVAALPSAAMQEGPLFEAEAVAAPKPAAKQAARADRPGAPTASRAPAAPRAERAPAPAKAFPVKEGRVETPAQRAENAYRRALASLEDGRVTEAMATLQAALKSDPRHEASRQTLVSLLMEAKRPEEAIRQLGAALALDPRQPAMAMLLARLQLERGSPGIDTLLRTLPYAAGNGEYHAFLAGALQHEGRHREAVEHYQAALRTAPQNGVWWMGLGISLQAEKRGPEAAGALQKALDSGTLSPELQGFVERKLKQLVR